jgi:protein-S-isoprenylcysteine O-methyltransferase Ste14
MSLWLAALIVVGVAALVGFVFVLLDRAVAKPLVPEAARGGPTLIVTGTLFAVLLAFVTLAAFQTYNGAKTGAAAEADAVLVMARTANLFPPHQRDQLRADFVCYGRAVVDQEWPAMRAGHPSPVVDYWIGAYRALFGSLAVNSPREQLSFQDLLNRGNDRTVGRQQRLTQATPAVPTPLWVALVLGGCIAVALQLGLCGSGVRFHAALVAGYAALVAAGLLVVYFLDHPYQPHTGGTQPSAMRRTLVMMRNLEPNLRVSCSANGQPV